MRPTRANITHISQNLKGCPFSCPNAWYYDEVKEGPDFSRRTSPEKVRDEADDALGPLVRKLYLRAQVEHMEGKSRDA
jgi:hypothetical protein